MVCGCSIQVQGGGLKKSYRISSLALQPLGTPSLAQHKTGAPLGGAEGQALSSGPLGPHVRQA